MTFGPQHFAHGLEARGATSVGDTRNPLGGYVAYAPDPRALHGPISIGRSSFAGVHGGQTRV